MYELVDSHCHLDFKDYNDDIEDVINRAVNNNIKYFLSISVDLENFENIKNLTRKYKNLWCTTGIHPNHVPNTPKFNLEKVYNKLNQNLKDDKVIGLGETGLDFYRSNENLKNQIDSFDLHLEISGKKLIPTIVHTRNADKETISILNSNVKKYGSIGLIHCFSSTKEVARIALENNFFISISGIITFKNAHELRDIVKYIPIEKLLLETDAPYLAPVPLRGSRNEPSYLTYTLDQIAKIKKLSIEDVATQTTNNFFSLFKKAKICNWK